MKRSPYHLTVHPGRKTHPPQLRRLSQESDDESSQSSTPSVGEQLLTPNASPSAMKRIGNPLMQQSFGTYVARYGTSRTMATTFPVVDTTAVQSIPENSSPWNLLHPLQQENTSPFPEQHVSIPMNEAKELADQQDESPLQQIIEGLRETFIDRLQSKELSRVRRNVFKLALPVILLVIANKLHLLPTSLITGERQWNELNERHLEGRTCVMNLFVDKHHPNEFNPDYDPTLPNGEIDPEAVAVPGTYRTKGQVEVINRFISSVAAAFRPEVELQQHVVFTGTRDGGHLAEAALQHWPARGTYRTQLHVFADGIADDELEYDTLETIEDRFSGTDPDEIHLYDGFGNKAGHEDDDDDDTFDEALRGHGRRLTVEKQYSSLPDLKKLIVEDEEDYDETIIPYLHVDGTTMAHQLAILRKVTPFLEEKKIAVIGLEHSPGMDVQEMIRHFHDLDYKTFMLGLRQLTRIDNLCPEVLDNVMSHPSLAEKNGWLPSLGGDSTFVPRMPPFFVAMPKGRHSQEEMSIQHMYDLFSGASGVLQVKTANDRVASSVK